eukprot:13951406-Alexandrium_andersonii.AAC.1
MPHVAVPSGTVNSTPQLCAVHLLLWQWGVEFANQATCRASMSVHAVLKMACTCLLVSLGRQRHVRLWSAETSSLVENRPACAEMHARMTAGTLNTDTRVLPCVGVTHMLSTFKRWITPR